MLAVFRDGRLPRTGFSTGPYQPYFKVLDPGGCCRYRPPILKGKEKNVTSSKPCTAEMCDASANHLLRHKFFLVSVLHEIWLTESMRGMSTWCRRVNHISIELKKGKKKRRYRTSQVVLHFTASVNCILKPDVGTQYNRELAHTNTHASIKGDVVTFQSIRYRVPTENPSVISCAAWPHNRNLEKLRYRFFFFKQDLILFLGF